MQKRMLEFCMEGIKMFNDWS